MTTIIGYNTTPSLSITLTFGSVEQTRLLIDPTDYTAGPGDTVTQVNLYVASGGSGADSNVQIGVYGGGTDTNPSTATLLFSMNLLVTAAMKAAPGWYNAAVSWNIGAFAGSVIRIAYGAPDAGTVVIGADANAGSNSINSGVHTLPTPYGQTTFNGTTMPGMYANVTPGGSVVPGTATLTVAGNTTGVTPATSTVLTPFVA